MKKKEGRISKSEKTKKNLRDRALLRLGAAVLITFFAMAAFSYLLGKGLLFFVFGNWGI